MVMISCSNRKTYKHSVWLFLLSFFLMLSVRAEPIIKEPSFSRLSTENGLSQDTIHSLLLDHQGLLWLATKSGLNRFDGHENILIAGPNDEFSDTNIQHIFQDSAHNLWVSTFLGGVYKFDPATNNSELVVDLPHSLKSSQKQIANHIIEDNEGNIWIGMEDTIFCYSSETGQLTRFFTLTDDLLSQGAVIRTLLVSDNILLVGTSVGLYGKDLNSKDYLPIDHVQLANPNTDHLNVKMLYKDKQNKLWIGTVEGLFSLPSYQLKQFLLGLGPMPKTSLNIKSRNIWQLVETQDGLFYIATDQGLFSYDKANQQTSHLFRPTDSRHYMSSDAFKALVLDKQGNIWIGSEADGALYWSPQSMLFSNVYNAHGGRDKKILSHNNVWSLYHQNDDNLWIGTRNGLNLYHLATSQTEQFMVSADDNAQYSVTSITNILPDGDSHLFLNTTDGLMRFNTLTKQRVPLNTLNAEDRAILTSNIWTAYLNTQGHILLVGEVGVFSYHPITGKVDKLEQLTKNLALNMTQTFLDGLPSKPDTTLLGTNGKLWEMDNHSYQLTLLHEIPKRQQKSIISPDSVLLDQHNIIWITYAGYGLVGLDADTYEQKYFYNKDNLLPNNHVFDIRQDVQGNLWLGSNSGLIRFNPQTQHAKVFDQSQGLINAQFNLGASTALNDGRLVYGSPMGLSFFKPQLLATQSDDSMRVVITNITLSNRHLAKRAPYLNNSNITLEHDDFGLTIHFSNLRFDHQQNTQYRYILTDREDSVYFTTPRPEVIFPKLEPGSYVFIVSAIDPNNGQETPQATLTIRVKYPLWASPLAYSLYAVLIGIFLLLLFRHGRAQNRLLFSAHQEVLSSNNKLTLALGASNSDIWEFKVEQDRFYAPRLHTDLGYSEVASFADHLSYIHNLDKNRYQKSWQDFIHNQHTELSITYRMRHKDGQWMWFHDVGRVVASDHQGHASVITGTYTNVTDTVADREKLRLFGETFKHTLDWVIIYDHRYLPVAFNEAFRQKFDIQEHMNIIDEMNDLYALQTTDTVQFWEKIRDFKAGEHWKGEDKIIFKDGTICDVEVHINMVANIDDKEKIEHILFIMADISEQKAAENQLRLMANYDALTGLPNRALLLDRIGHGVVHANRHDKNMALFFIDLDKFKQVNDSLGHKAGDELLVIMAKRLSQKLRKEDTVARLGGDEFVIMIEDVDTIASISVLVTEISQLIDLPITLQNQTVSVSSSIGIAMYPGDGSDADQLLRNADIAMYHAKAQGPSSFQFFTQRMNELVKDRLVLENKIKDAHRLKIFENYYQPIINIYTNQLEGFEILMRWSTPNGMTPPNTFIPIAEELGLIVPMTFDAFERAMPVLKSIRELGFTGYLSFNLSAKHFENQSSIERIMLLLEQHQIPVNSIRFEITESALMRDYDKAHTYMEQIQKKGFMIALDDFGTGYSSLKYLKEFPIDIIKVDKSFVDDIGKNKNDEAIILTTLNMAKLLNMTCIAEGIETLVQLEFFKEHDCQYLQGYYFSKPVPAQQLPELLHKDWLA
jgi:diguanylate cyclase (GGDEF)-like protein